MDPITGLLAGTGMALQVAGAIGNMVIAGKESRLAGQEYQIEKENLQLQQQENDYREIAMGVAARASQTRAFRQSQLAGALSATAAANQGVVQGSSAYAAGQGQAAAEGAYNETQVSQNFQIGTKLFGIQRQVTTNQGRMADLESSINDLKGQGAIWSGIAQIGGALSGSAGPAGNILGNMFQGGPSPDSLANAQGSGYNATWNYQNQQGFALGGV